jgi:hypothetical protein
MIQEKLHKLFDYWKTQRRIKRFVPDGVVDEIAWNSAEKKLFWILKDSNSSFPNPGGLFDPLRQFVERQAWPTETLDWQEDLRPANWAFWPNILRRSYGVEHYPCRYVVADQNFRQSGIWKRIGGLNLKKAAGESEVADTVIVQAASTDREFILEELQICKPDVVLCGGTFDVFCDVVLRIPHEANDWAWWGSVAIIGGGHPSRNGQPAYDYAMKAYQAALGARPI